VPVTIKTGHVYLPSCHSPRNAFACNDLLVGRVTDPTPKKSRNLLKTIPGLLISAFFLWYTFKGISFAQLMSVRFVHPVWIFGVVAFTLASYTLRCVRWTRMMLPTGAGFGVCARVLMTSLAANNILPLRIGDIMRVFTYAGDLGASPSVILSTVILEKLLDIFILVLLFVSTMGPGVSPHFRLLAAAVGQVPDARIERGLPRLCAKHIPKSEIGG